ncbi:SDR family NAD(P)-dependent oxidoreductase [Salinarimonas sp.]|uniref:SDR family NAD(P)-dependent oxidoreductase n=1 Tax=Salinarimonas sp. TaxID=2766526 RepID=UPI0032D8F5C4
MQIAIVGIACRLPGCPDRRTFWDRLLAGEECLTRFGREEMLADGVPPRLLDDPRYVPVAGFVADADRFDAAFFHATPAEARRTDPQQRLLLECAYHALGDAGYAPATAPGAVSVYAGTGANVHFWRDLEHAAGDPSRQFLSYVGNDKDFAATRIAYRLGLNGAAVSVQTACSTALVGVHLACQSLILGESDLALAGACSLRLPGRAGYLHEPDGIESPDGHCRPFDRDAAGTVFGDGVAMLALRRLDDALASGDRIHAVIRGSAVNNDGADKLGFTAPSEAGQIGAVAEALAVAGCEPADLSFVEAHGTGTALGDAVEVAALAAVFAGSTRSPPCPLGSVKANIGHTDTVAGAAGLIKAALALRHGVLPPQVNFSAADPRLGLADRGFAVHDTPQPITGRGMAGVSSFGIGGSNAHVVLEAPPERPRRYGRPLARARIFPVAAADPEALERRLRDLAETVARDRPDPDDLSVTLRRTQAGLRSRHVRIATGEEAPFSVEDPGAAPRAATAPTDAPPTRVFLMPGQGAQHAGMGRGLYEAFPAYRDVIDAAAAILDPLIGDDVRRVMFDGARSDLAQTRLTQPLVFVTDVACARLLQAFGLAPETVIGHSLGEYAAACIAGVFDFADGVRLVARRGALMQALPPGRMVAVGADVASVSTHLRGSVSIAASNAPDVTVISGPPADVAEVEAALEEAGHACRPLATSHAFHSAMMEPMLEAFHAELERIALRPPRLPVVSNLTGKPLTDAEATAPDYWCRQLRAPVLFADGLETVLRRGRPLLLETGPGRTLTSLALRHPATPRGTSAHAVLAHPQERRDEVEVVLHAVGGAWTAGAEVDWAPLGPTGDAQVVDLPPYPFARERHWLEPAAPRAEPEPAPVLPQILLPAWRRDPRPGAVSGPGALAGTWLVEDAGDGLAAPLVAALASKGAQARAYAPGRLGDAFADDVAGLVLTGAGGDALERIVAVARAVDGRGRGRALAVGWLTAGLFDVTGTERLEPQAAVGLGAMRCLPLEHPEVACLIADADDPVRAAPLLAADLAAGIREPVVAYRAGRRWLPTEEAVPEARDAARIAGPVLITGGHGGVGRIAAAAVAALAGDDPVDVYLLSRSGGRVTAPSGVRLHDLTGDVAKPGTLSDAVATILRRHGRLGGVVHAAGSLDPSGFGPLAGAMAAAWSRHRPAKVEGAAALVRALDGIEHGFCLLVSSLSTRLGGVGYGAYAAANAVLDATAEAQGRLGRPWLAADLDAFVLDDRGTGDDALTPASGRAALVRLIGAAMGGLTGAAIVSATPYGPRRDRWMRIATSREVATAARSSRADPGPEPEDPLEAAWRDVLGVEQCGDDENFFELGGSSLLALQILSRIRRSLGVEIGLADFLAAPTLAGLRAATGARAADRDEPPAVADRTVPLPILPGQRSIWIAEQMSPERSNFAVNAAYRIAGALDAPALQGALAALAARHEPLRTRFVAVDGAPRQVIDPPPTGWRLPIAEAAEDDAAAMEAFFARPFDLAADPPWRARLLRHGPDRHTLLLSLHHIVVDDWSIGLLLEDLGTLYRAARAGAPPIAADPVQFADICLARSRRADDDADIAYWREALADLPSAPPLPADVTAPPDDRPHAGGVVTATISADLLSRVRAAAAAAETTPFVWLLTAFGIALAGSGGTRDVVLGTPLAGRSEPGADRMVGYFVNPAVLRIAVADAASFADQARRCAGIVAAAHAHGTVPVERVQEALGLPAGTAPFRAWMTLLTHVAPRRLDDGLAVTPLRLADRPARIPIALVLEPEGDGLVGHLEFARSLYHEDTIADLSAAFLRVLERSVAAPDTEVAEMLALCDDIRTEAKSNRTERFADNQRRRLATARRSARSVIRGTES